ncbi:lipoprotein [Nakamurella lactea]|uniref:lipoprotein n=1 Tax=Nakamurella lactea TaxID=459515 RepID=UPI00048F7862|nr:hypothetical protein [Nakamurella lactea]
MRRSLIAALLLVLVAGCSRAPGAYQPSDIQQQGVCDGVAQPAELTPLGPTADVTAAVVCGTTEKYVKGKGSWDFTVVRAVPAEKIPALVTALRLPDASGTADACTAMLVMVPGFVLTLADGSRIRPGVPGDGCHPRHEVLDALDVATSITTETRGTQVRSELEVTTNCGATAKSPAVWQSETIPGLAKLPPVPGSGSVSVCRYRGTPDQEGPLVAAGLQPAGVVAAGWPTAAQVGSLRCDTPDDVLDVPPVDWLMFLRTPTPPYRLDDAGGGVFALLELGGCGRLVDPVNGTAWSADLDVGTRLAALADHPVG